MPLHCVWPFSESENLCVDKLFFSWIDWENGGKRTTSRVSAVSDCVSSPALMQQAVVTYLWYCLSTWPTALWNINELFNCCNGWAFQHVHLTNHSILFQVLSVCFYSPEGLSHTGLMICTLHTLSKTCFSVDSRRSKQDLSPGAVCVSVCVCVCKDRESVCYVLMGNSTVYSRSLSAPVKFRIMLPVSVSPVQLLSHMWSGTGDPSDHGPLFPHATPNSNSPTLIH